MDRFSVHFLPPKALAPAEQHAFNLADSAARSHAAKISHSRSRHGRDRFRNTTTTQVPQKQAWNDYHSKEEALVTQKRNCRPSWARIPDASPCNLLPGVGSGTLDPFLCLADELNQTDKLRLQQYLTLNTPTDSLTGHGPDFCRVRDVLIPKLAVSALTVQCLMLIVDLSLQTSAYSVCERRVVILHKLQRLVEHSDAFKQPSTAVALATLIVAEYRAGNLEAAKCHGSGLQRWMHVNGGLREVDSHSLDLRIGILNVFTYFDLPVITTKARLSQALYNMRLPTGHSVPNLKQHLYPIGEGQQVSVLYIMNLLLECGMPAFQSTLEHRVLKNDHLASGAMIYLIATTAEEHPPETKFATPLRIGDVVEFVHLLSFAGKSWRTTVVRYLSSVLQGAPPTPVNMERLKEDIQKGWLRSRCQEVTPSHRRYARCQSLPLENADGMAPESHKAQPHLLRTIDVSIDNRFCPFKSTAGQDALKCPMRALWS